ncbi:MAG: TonB-dependent receptor, partial [Bacteroidetes bacterium]
MKKLFFVVLLLIQTIMTYSQVEVTGTVKSSDDGLPLPGVNVVLKGTTTGTITDMDGKFNISVPEDGVIVFRFMGYEIKELQVDANTTNIDVVLQVSKEMLDEVVVTGYATIKKANLTGSVAAVDFEDLESIPSSNAISMLQGRVSGVDISNFSTQPGNDDPRILIRGMGTFNSGANPLVIVDGVESSLGQIPAGDIESISVLKDAASASIYGVRAANGVILVTTKSGKPGKTIINFNSNIGFQQNLMETKLLGSVDFANVRNAWQIAEGATEGWYTDGQIDSMRNGSDLDRFANTNWI